jgi:hypothetical protein
MLTFKEMEVQLLANYYDLEFSMAFHNILQGRANRPFSTGKRASNSIQDPRHVGFLSSLN